MVDRDGRQSHKTIAAIQRSGSLRFPLFFPSHDQFPYGTHLATLSEQVALLHESVPGAYEAMFCTRLQGAQ